MSLGAEYGLIAHLPAGDVEFCRERDGAWSVGIYEDGSTKRLATVATGMDKAVAAWLVLVLRNARIERGRL